MGRAVNDDSGNVSIPLSCSVVGGSRFLGEFNFGVDMGVGGDDSVETVMVGKR